MDADEILRRRLANQHLSTPADDPAELVASLGAVQAQDYPAACWALGLRLENPNRAVVERAMVEGAMLRTHVLRPTWHLVHARDIRWLLALTGPRVKARTATRRRTLGLDDATIARAETIMQQALSGGRSLTRPELGDVLREHGLAIADGGMLAHLLGHAELDALVCSGPPRGRQQTYALLDERVPPTPALTHEEGLAELTWRYFSSHGPALPGDCTWWSGLSLRDVRLGLELNQHRLAHATVEGRTYWFDEHPFPAAWHSAYLLPNFDEYTVAYRHRDLFDLRVPGWSHPGREDVPFADVVIVDGRVAGRWRRTAPQPSIAWRIEPSPAEQQAVEHELGRYTTFMARA